MKFGLLVFFAAGTLAAPFLALDENLPRTEVKDVDCSSTRFRRGHAFTYDYEGETLNNVEGSSKHVTGLLLRTRIIITALSECNFRMQLGNAELLSKSKNQELFSVNADSAKFQKELEQNELLFSMKGNKITTLKVHSTEPTHILNIKRGILSTLQFDESSKTEVDIHGECATTYESGVKSKILSECGSRAQNEIGIQTASIKTESSLRPLDSSSRCQYMFDSHLITSVVCEESHLFKPFSAGYKTPSGAMTTVRQSMKLTKTKTDRKSKHVSEDFGVETTLVFDHSNEELKSGKTVHSQVEQIMSRLVDHSKLSAKQESAHEFSSLVFALRKMDEKPMKAVWNKYFDCIASQRCGLNDVDLRDVYRQYILDAVAYCGTSTCISVVHDVILSGDVNGERMNMFLQSIALVAKTTKNMIRDVLNIVEKKPSRQAFLTLGTLMSRHCGKYAHECDYEKNHPITRAEAFLEKILGKECENQENHDRVEEILMALKAIGNAKRPKRAFQTILGCARKAMHANITRAAYDAMRGFPCDERNSEDLTHIVSDSTVDPEKRIHAFIALMKCPTNHVIAHVVHMLKNEPTKQVASFIWSHLTNIMESSDPKNAVAKKILQHITKNEPMKNFDLPIHHYSRSYEKSFHFDSIKSGATAEGHIIFHPDGYLPRSALINITAEVMGVPVNLIEAMVGMDGVEALIESVFGVDGVFPDNVVFKMFNFTMTTEKFRELAQQRENRRNRRSVKDEDKITKLHNRVNKVSPKPSGHISFKIMGQEVRVMSYDDIFWMIDQIDSMNVIQLLLNVAKGGHKTFSKSAMFLEMTHTVPTGLGLPLKLKLVGSTVATVELDGKFDIRNMFWGPGSLYVNGYVKPSAVVEISGQMGVDSHYVSTGVFVNSSMFVSNMMKGSLVYKAGQTLKINMDTPEEPIQLFNFSSTPFTYLNNDVHIIEGVARKINPDFCMKSQMLGYGLCTRLRLPIAFREYESPYYPLSGPAYFGMKLVRGDEKLKTFRFLVSMTKKSSITTGKIEFSTPGATYERKLSGEMMYKDIDNIKTLVLSTERAGKEASVEFNYNTISHRAEIQTKSNLFTKKNIITKIVYFNQTNLISQQYGMLMSAEYDWYKFEHVTKYVRKSTGYMLHSSTLYYPKKTVTGVIEYNTKDQKVTARLDSEQLKQSVEFSGKWEKSGDEKGLTLTATHLTSGKSASVYGGIINKENKKEFTASVNFMEKTAKNILGYYNKGGIQSIKNYAVMNGKTATLEATLENKNTLKTVTVVGVVMGKKASVVFDVTNKQNEKSMKMFVKVAGKSAVASIDYFNKDSVKTLKAEVDVFGRKAEVFANLHSAEGYQTTLGGVFGKYIGGFRGVYSSNHGHGKSLCSSLYYGTTSAEKEPVTMCVNFHSLGKTFVHHKLTFTAEMKDMKKKGELVFNFEKHTVHMVLKAEVKYNSKVYAKNFYSLTYKGLMNSELKMDVSIGKYNGGYKLFIKQSGSKANVGFEVYGMEKTILFLNQYETSNLDATRKMKVLSQVIVNGKVLPVTTDISYIYGGGLNGPTFRLNVGKYSFVYSTVGTFNAVQYGWGMEFMAMKETNVFLKVYKSTTLSYSKSLKGVNQKFGAVVAGRKYEYGWEAEYKNLGTVSKSAHAVTLRVQYSTTRKSSITFTLANSKRSVELLVNFEYIPTKAVSHSFRYNKNNRQLDISIEFLPKMFAKFMARLDKNQGYSMTTDMGVEWDNYKKSMKVLNAFKNNKKIMELSSTIGKDFISFAATFMKTSPKTIKLSAIILKRNVKLVGVYGNRNVQLRAVYNKRMLFNVVADYDDKYKVAFVSVSNSRKTLFKVSSDYNEYAKKITVSVSGMKEWVKVTGKYDETRKSIITSFSVMDKEYFKAIAGYTTESVSLTMVAAQLKRHITFVGELNKENKEISIFAKSSGKKVGVSMRADWDKLVMGANVFSNKYTSGWQVAVRGSSLTYRVIITPTVSGQVVFEIKNDRVLKMSVQRQTGAKAITEVSYKFKLSKNMCQFALQWNTKTIKKIINLVKPLVKSVIKDVTKYSTKVVKISKEFIIESADDAGKAALNFVRKMDKSFDDIDFVAARNKVGTLTLKGLRKLSELIRRSLKEMAKNLEAFKNNLPEWIHKTKRMTLNAKETLRNLQVDLERNMKEINAIVMKVVRNLTKSSAPVVNKAIELIKEFKIRGKSMKEIVVLAKEIGQKYLAICTKEANVQWVILNVKAIEVYTKGAEYILKVKIPYRKETVKDVLEIISKKVAGLKKKISDVDIKKALSELQVTVMEYKIQDKQIKEHLVILKKDLKNLPENSKKAILDFIQIIRVAIKKIEQSFSKVSKFAKPLTNHVKFVSKSVKKHFGPIIAKSLKKFEKRINEIKVPSIRPYLMKQWQVIENFFLPLLNPIKPLFNSIKNQIRKISVMGFKVGGFTDLQMIMLNDAVETYMKQSNKMMTEQIEKLNNYVEVVSNMSLEEMVEKVFDSSAVMSKNVIEYVTKMYKMREVMMKERMDQAVKLYNKVRAQYVQLTSKSFEEAVETFIHITSESMISTADELSKLLKQIAALNVAEPTWRAWKQADVLEHLNKYGVNAKILKFIKASKDIDFEKVILKSAKAIKQFIYDVHANMYIKAVQAYGRATAVTDYIRSIPKKEYEQWYIELKDFTFNNKDNAINFFTKVGKITQKRAEKLVASVKKASEINYNTYVEEYVEPAKHWYTIIAAKSKLVYADIKQPTIDVTKHYKDIVSELVNKNYGIVCNKAVKEYKNIVKQLKEKVTEINALMEKQYEKFLNKYGDMTWEEIGEKAYTYAEKQSMVAKEMAVKEYKKMKKLVAKLQMKAEEMYKKAVTEYKKNIKYFETEIKPNVMKMYEKYSVMAKKHMETCVSKCKQLYGDAKKNVMMVYNDNKDKTLKALYIEIKTIIVKELKKQYTRAITFVNKKKVELKTLATKYYTKADVLMRTIILPELKKETESLINQTLRASVVMANETVEAYYPHFVFTKDFIVRSCETFRSQAVVAFEKSKVTVQENMDTLIKLLKELLEKLQRHEVYKNAVNHKYVVQAKLKLKELIKITKQKIEELKTHSTTVKYQKKAEIKIAELKKHIAVYKSKLEAYYKHPKVVEILKTLKQVKKSGLFTYNKLSERISLALDISTDGFVVMKDLYLISAKEAAVYFRQEPEEAFWNAIVGIKVIGKDVYKMVKAIEINKDSLEEHAKKYFSLYMTIGEELIHEFIDDWTKETVKSLYKDAITMAKKIETNVKALPEKMKQLAKNAYKKYTAQVITWYKEQKKTMKAQWKLCPCRAFFMNRLWKELADEASNHELVEAVQTIAGMTKVKLMELKRMAIKELKKQKVILEKKVNELKSKLNVKYDDMKNKGIEKYNQVIKKYNELIKKADNFVSTTTIADIVDFVAKQYKQAVKEIEKTKEQLLELKVKYTAKAKALYVKYETKAKEMYKKMYAKADALVMKYKSKMVPYYTKCQGKVMKVWNKYYPIAVAKYEKLYKEAESKYEELSKQLKEKYVEYKKEAKKFVKKTKKQAYNKWMISEIRSKLIALKKMSIRETIEALKKLPKQTKTLAVATYNKYYKLASAKLERQYQNVIKQTKIQRERFINMMRPYTIPTMKVVRWIQNEVRETGLFIYRYYRIADQYKNAKSFIVSEYKRLVPLVKVNADKYAALYKNMATSYAEKGVVYAKQAATSAGHKTLRGIHSTMKYIDSLDVEMMKDEVKGYYTEILKYVSFDLLNGQIMVTFHHRDVTPSFKHHIKKIGNKAKRAIRSLRAKGNNMLKKVNAQLIELKNKAEKLKNQIQKQVMENTVEIRADLQKSFDVNNKIVQRVYSTGKIFAQNVYKKAMLKCKLAKSKTTELLKQAKSLSKVYYKQYMALAKKAYLKAGVMFWDMYEAGPYETYTKLREYSVKYYGIAKRQSMKMYRNYKPVVKQQFNKQIKSLKLQVKQLRKTLQPLYQTVKTAYKRYRSGVSLKTVFKPIYTQIVFAQSYYEGKVRDNLRVMKLKFCKADPKLCRYLKEAGNTHKSLFDKYFGQLMELYIAGKVRLHSHIRKTTMLYKLYASAPNYNEVGMIFSNKHVVTFDNKFYNFIDYKKPECTYMLAHDFIDDKFSIMSQEKAIIVKTPEMKIEIHANGKTKTTIGKSTSDVLPVETKSNQCYRIGPLIMCHFMDQKFKIVVDLKHFVTTVSLSSWHFGKSQGILGTNNRESYDDWKLPNGKSANNVYQLANAYEVTGNPKCRVQSIKAKACNKVPSTRCKEIFERKSSLYAASFKHVDPKPFLEACKQDTSECEQKESMKTAHCDTSAAFVLFTRAKGRHASFLDECMSVGSHAVNEEWNQKSLKNTVDIVVMVSQRANIRKTKNKISNVLFHLQRSLKKQQYKTQYALVGFGGEGINERAHIQPLSNGDNIFGNVLELIKQMKGMPYKGKGTTTNDAYHAILLGSTLRFRAGASKIFILFNTEPHTSHETGPTFDETLYKLKNKANASLFVFDKFNFKHLSRGHGQVIGQSTQKVYTVKQINGSPLKSLELPSTAFHTMAFSSNGGVFSNNIKGAKAVASSLNNAIKYQLKIDNDLCKTCRVEPCWTGVSKVICQSRNDISC